MTRKAQIIVEGSGTFPLDMLRYDRCYPATSADAIALVGKGKRQITLVAETVTSGRWTSFLWKVISSKAMK